VLKERAVNRPFIDEINKLIWKAIDRSYYITYINNAGTERNRGVLVYIIKKVFKIKRMFLFFLFILLLITIK